MLNLNTVVVNSYREAARAGQRGMQKLQRKVRSRQSRINFLEKFIHERQLTSELEAIEQRQKEERYGAYRAEGL